ncbi:MAG: DUF420 domain-containing protein [Clostridiales bacterium]|nr:DUF420 domain-containing protein [Clostridiales bacterium]
MSLLELARWDTVAIVLSGLSLLVGRIFIARKNVTWHRFFMITATVLAALFLVLYVVRTALFGSTSFPYGGPIRTVYFAILITHMVAATAVAPLALITLYRAHRGDFQRHKKIARITFPTWLYTAATGWLVYYFLHQYHP